MLKYDNVGQLLANELLADINVISLVTGNEKNVNIEESASEERVVQFNSKQIDGVLTKVNDYKVLFTVWSHIPKGH